MFPHFCEAVKGIVKEEPRLRIFEVYDPLEKVPLDTSGASTIIEQPCVYGKKRDLVLQ